MRDVLRKNYEGYLNISISLKGMIEALKKDKKNTSSRLSLILPYGDNVVIKKFEISLNQEFISQCNSFFEEVNS